MKHALAAVILSLIKAYQAFISPHLPATCRYYPTCSAYAAEAVRRYGPFKGTKLAFSRIMRCHPFHPGGYDPLS